MRETEDKYHEDLPSLNLNCLMQRNGRVQREFIPTVAVNAGGRGSYRIRTALVSLSWTTLEKEHRTENTVEFSGHFY